MKHFCSAASCRVLQILSRDKAMLEAKLLEIAGDEFNAQSSFLHIHYEWTEA